MSDSVPYRTPCGEMVNIDPKKFDTRKSTISVVVWNPANGSEAKPGICRSCEKSEYGCTIPKGLVGKWGDVRCCTLKRVKGANG